MSTRAANPVSPGRLAALSSLYLKLIMAFQIKIFPSTQMKMLYIEQVSYEKEKSRACQVIQLNLKTRLEHY